MMRALVTGSTGFVGGALCATLLERGFSVRAFHRTSSNLSLIKDLPVEHAIGDLTQPESLVSAMKDIDVVFHTAALLSNSNKLTEHIAITVKGTRSVMDAAIQQKVQRVVHTSSIAALGIPSFPSEMLPPEKSPLLNEFSTWNIKPEHWLYGYSKYRAELEIQTVVGQGLDVVITNPSFVVGPGDIYRIKDSPFVFLSAQPAPFIPTGGVNIVHVKDVANGQVAALENGKRGERYILGNENITFKSMIELVSNLSHQPMPRITIPGKILRGLANPLQFMRSIINLPVPIELLRYAGYGYYVDNQKSIKELNFKYQYSAEQAIKDAYQWFQGQK